MACTLSPGRAVGMGLRRRAPSYRATLLDQNAPAQLNRENLNQFPTSFLPLDTNLPWAFGCHGPTAAPLGVDPKRSVLLVARGGHDHLLG